MHARALLAMGRGDEALEAAREGHTLLEESGAEEGESAIRLTWAELLMARGRREEARRAIAEARERLVARAGSIADAERKERSLRDVPEHARTLALWRSWVSGDDSG